MSRRFKVGVVALLLLVVSAPYVLGFAVAGKEWVFNGFLLNPLDGHSYLAKMIQGEMGNWRFSLPYTAEPGQGGFIFLNYLALGQLARVVGLPLILVFHLVRLSGAVLMSTGLIRFYEETLVPARRVAEQPTEFAVVQDTGAKRDLAGLLKTGVILGLFGGGLGSVALFFGLLPSDLWVAEMYPFLSAYINPHFPLGLGLILWMLVLVLRGTRTMGVMLFLRYGLSLAAMSLLLAAVQPFGIVVLAMVVGGSQAWTWVLERRIDQRGLTAAGAALGPGGLYLLYQYVIIQADPVLAGWNSQNVTSSPPAWDFILSLSPVLLLSGLAAWVLLREGKPEPGLRMLLVWALAGAVLAYLPFMLQRRLLTGYYVPLAGLAVVGLSELRRYWPSKARLLPKLAVGLALPSTALVLLINLFGILSHAPEYYLTRDEVQALDWLRNHSAPGALVLAGPDMGLYIPSQTGRRVIYGHPFETVNAKREEQAVLAVFSGEVRGTELEQFLDERSIDLIVYGEREQTLGGEPAFLNYPVVFEQGKTRVFATRERP
jgi:hypothetical protein